jgi:LPXTG-site transpeptidase (sortase) family protein
MKLYQLLVASVVAGGLFGAGFAFGPTLSRAWLDGPVGRATAADDSEPMALPTKEPTVEAPEAPAVVPTIPATGFVTRSLPPERLVIPAIGLDTRVVPLSTRFDRGSVVWETAAFAVGHHAGSANPGEVGNVVLSGHISSPREGDVFRKLPQVKVNDGIIVSTAQQNYLYRVRDVKVVLPSAVEVLDPTDESVVTLITCVPDGVYSHRLVVRAEPV